MTQVPTRQADTARAAACLAAAFADDPFFTWLFPSRGGRRPALAKFFSLIAAGREDHDELWVTPDHASAGLWLAPRFDPAEPTPDPEREVAFGALMAELAGDHVPQVWEMFGRIGEAHPTEPHWYLAAVGTRPEAQGQGLGAALLAPVLDRCDAEGLPAYLESSNPRNLPFYFRLGFVETGRISTPDDAAHLVTMWREPRT